MGSPPLPYAMGDGRSLDRMADSGRSAEPFRGEEEAETVVSTSCHFTQTGNIMNDGWLRSTTVSELTCFSSPNALVACPARHLLHFDSGRCSVPWRPQTSLGDLPNEVLLHILGFLDVNDLLSTSRTSHHLRCLSVSPVLHNLRLRHTRTILAPLLTSPSRPTLADLIARHIFLTKTTIVSRKLARSLTSIQLSRRLAARLSVEALVARSVLPPECAPGFGHVSPALAARTRAIERERVKDGLRRWVGMVWKSEVGRRSENIRRREEVVGIGRVWRLRKYWERVARGEL